MGAEAAESAGVPRCAPSGDIYRLGPVRGQALPGGRLRNGRDALRGRAGVAEEGRAGRLAGRHPLRLSPRVGAARRRPEPRVAKAG